MKLFFLSRPHWNCSEVKYFKMSELLTCNIREAFDRLRIVSIESCEVVGNFNRKIQYYDYL